MSAAVVKAPNPLAIHVGQRVRVFRKRKGMKQETLAAEVAYGSRSGIASIEAGDVLPSLDKAIEIAKVLGVSVDALVSRDEVEQSEHSTPWFSVLKQIVLEMTRRLPHNEKLPAAELFETAARDLKAPAYN